jgi:DNA (cytosine-5)-methyltransferase 1
VLGSLAALGYDAEWHCIPACAVGAPHRRDRVWIVAYAECAGSQGHRGERGLGEGGEEVEAGGDGDVADASRELPYGSGPRGAGRGEFANGGWWESEPDVGRVAHGIPARVDRLRGLGNAIVPQIAELLGYAILAHAESVRLTEVPA